jgi:hypothetical protein
MKGHAVAAFTALGIVLGMGIAGSSFYIGTVYQKHRQPFASTKTPTPPKMATSNDMEKTLRLDTLCGQSAALFAKEHTLGDALPGTRDFSQHHYNSEMGKCFVLLQTVMQSSSGSLQHEWLYDPVDQTQYGEYRIDRSLKADGPPTENIVFCSLAWSRAKASAGIFDTCKKKEVWQAFVGIMMNQGQATPPLEAIEP